MEKEREVSIYEVLDAREKRVERQKAFIEQYKQPIICFMLNIPGAVKTSPKYEMAFWLGVNKILHKLERYSLKIVATKTFMPVTGYEAYFSVEGDARKIKELVVQIEEEGNIGRLFDIDVIQLDGKKVSREDISRPSRKCLLCGKNAYQCARSRTHSVKSMLEYIDQVLDEIGDGEKTYEI
ncbi:MAG: citrate lyase holo-[acyl-carrier protein] synthase [Lachnospiraceae bacterium]